MADELRDSIASQQVASPLGFHWEGTAGLRANWDAYVSRRARCQWVPSRAQPIVNHEASQEEYNAHILTYVPFPWCDPFCHLGTAVPKSVSCSVAASDDVADQETWRIQRVGPVTSTGGNDFIIFRGSDAFDLSADLEAHGKGTISAIFLAAVDA
jgi:hypothetical protein